ncbi:Protein N-terminal glutamine amidohydrolase [Apostasia shenzhenica]|uniref:Protein N-terminal glutamine amidohydrolase n=1 Tax=Apostasia shenzhenica TaxID=1088818 RepID=A0A2I0B468_9ASPA|nr:Protein N-terminal glutamine amidohydrolase [Apostasia shenzhenica]
MAEVSQDEDGGGTAGASVDSLLPPAPSISTANPDPDFSAFTYTPFYCEENAYLLCKKLCMLGLANPKGIDLFVVFISNDDKKVRRQKKVGESSSYSLIWDLDSDLPFPLLLNQYVSEAFRAQVPLKSTYRRLLRVIHAPIFLRHFGSNRSHMKDSLGNWISSPPAYEPIIAEDGTENNFEEYARIRAADAVTDIKDLAYDLYSNKFGIVISETLLEELFSCKLVGAEKVQGEPEWLYCLGHCFDETACPRLCANAGMKTGSCRELTGGDKVCCCPDSS